MTIPEITVQDLQTLRQSKIKFFLLDVRNPDEYNFCNLGGYLIPVVELPARLQELNPKEHIIVHCHAGGRSRRAVEFLMSQGFSNVHNLRGGITAWSNEIDPEVPVY
jgi:sulfur-carrier protein adenylyltransferase/sulfurtransferase